ncbi:hypothetical protein XYCOK13_24490 [Xylanibacillus composti]|uniref:Response regulator n=1 Tax=Xylanibacillus composti TaxID=1572762 RepID=A0A8J4H4R8_9BACL|nr:response regulator [Xylanibacillus composti]GIQ69625.1 hypothetical protein XYCOK13_24490 [Xylanibacillus composti]
MFNLLIVDDHPYQVDSIVYTVEQSSLDVGAIYKAHSAAEALEWMKRETIHIVITDIRMPEISGIGLIERIRQTSKQVKCILLSSYADFEYAQQALELQTSKYLMKPVKTHELIETLQNVMEQLRAEQEAEQTMQQTIYTFRENLPILRERLLQKLLSGENVPKSELTHKLSAYNLPFEVGDNVALAVFQLEDDLTGYNEYDVSLLMYAVSNIAEEVFGDCFDVWHTRFTAKRLVMLAKTAGHKQIYQPQGQLERKAKELQRLVYRYLKHMLSVGVLHSWRRFPEDLAVSYEKAKRLLRSQEGKAAGFFAGVEDLPDPTLQGLIESLYAQPSLMTLLETGRWQDARARLEIIFAELEQKWMCSSEYLSEAFFIIAGTFQFVAHKNGKRLIDVIGVSDHALIQEYIHWDLSAFRSWVLRSLERLQILAASTSYDQNRSLIQRIHQFIETNLEKDVSLQSISEAVGLHPSYVSKVYREETGLTLSDYLLQYRLEYSAELLRNTDCKVYEVSSRVGYQTPHYFIKLFKKAYGMTPQQFRNTLKGASG